MGTAIKHFVPDRVKPLLNVMGREWDLCTWQPCSSLSFAVTIHISSYTFHCVQQMLLEPSSCQWPDICRLPLPTVGNNHQYTHNTLLLETGLIISKNRPVGQF